MESTVRQKRLLLVGVILLIIAGAYRLLPFMTQFAATEENSFTEQRVFTLQKKLVQKKRLEGQQLALNRLLNKLENGLLRGATGSLAAVTMQNLLYDLANKYGVEIQTVRVLKPEKNSDEGLLMYVTISIQARMELTTSQLKEILGGLAESSNLLVIDTLSVQVSKKGQTGRIKVTLTLTGVMLANEM